MNWLEYNTHFPCCSTAHGRQRSKLFREPRAYSKGYTAKMLRQELLLSHNRLGKQSFKDFLPQHSQAKGYTEVHYMTSLVISESSMH